MTFKQIICRISVALAVTIAAPAATVTFNTGGTACSDVNAGLCTTAASAHQIDFNSATAPSPFVDGAATFSFSPANVSPFVTGSVGSQYAAPPNDTTQYLSVGTPGRAGEVVIDFDMGIGYYGLYLGSPDGYNLFTFFETGNNVTAIASFTGNQLIPPGQGNQSIGQYINFFANEGTIGRIVLSSSQAALETDNHAYVVAGGDPSQVPEPATMGLMGSALTCLSLFARRWRR
jgi:hypothetical protein